MGKDPRKVTDVKVYPGTIPGLCWQMDEYGSVQVPAAGQTLGELTLGELTLGELWLRDRHDSLDVTHSSPGTPLHLVPTFINTWHREMPLLLCYTSVSSLRGGLEGISL